MGKDSDLEKYLIESRDKYKTEEEKQEFSRRLEWSVLLSEECYQEEVARLNHINTLVSSLLVASSFLTAAFVELAIDSDYDNIALRVLLIVSGSFLGLSLMLQLFLVVYKRIARSKSIYDIAKTYLDKDVSFDHDYSENYGRILSLDILFKSLKKNNNCLARTEIIATILLGLFLLSFFACFFVR